MIPIWYCGAGLGGVVRLISIQRRNQTCALVCAKIEWCHGDSWGLGCDGLEEGQEAVAIVYGGVQRLGSGLICLSFIRRIFVLCLHAAFTFVIVVVFPFLRPLRDGAIENIQELSCVQLPVAYCSLREEWREEDGVERRPVLLIFRVREVAGGGAKENFRDGETDLVAFRDKSDVYIDGNQRRWV